MQIDMMVEYLIDEVADAPISEQLPDHIEQEFIFSPEIVLDLLRWYMKIDHEDHEKLQACLKLISRGFDQIRYDLDRKSPKAKKLLNKVQDKLSEILSDRKSDKLASLNAVIYESRLPFTLDIKEEDLFKHNENLPDIMPKLPEFMEKARREFHFRSSFDLYDAFMAQIQLMPKKIQLGMIAELANTPKEIPHEVAVLMLLHPKPDIREGVAQVLLAHVHEKVFTAVDLRRLIVLRNWVLPSARDPIDHLIKTIRLQKISPAPILPCKIDAIVASVFDGAGAQLVFFSVKQQSNRMVGGFILKQGVGIRDPWINTKAAKGEFESAFEGFELPFKPVTINYVNKAVKHFLAEGLEQGNIPTPSLLQIAELLGTTEWQPEFINVRNELDRLSIKSDINLADISVITASFKRSSEWDVSESFFRYWFEAGELVQKKLRSMIKKHKSADHETLEDLVIKEIISPAAHKWKTIMVFMSLWAKSKVEKGALLKDFMILTDQLESGVTPLTDIPAIRNMAKLTIGSFLTHVDF